MYFTENIKANQFSRFLCCLLVIRGCFVWTRERFPRRFCSCTQVLEKKKLTFNQVKNQWHHVNQFKYQPHTVNIFHYKTGQGQALQQSDSYLGKGDLVSLCLKN